MAYTYPTTPAPRTGQGPFGMVPGNIALPQPAQDLAAAYPNLGQTNAAVSRSIMAGLEGELSPATINALQDANAAFGISSGMPGMRPGSFLNFRLGRNIGTTAEALKNQAIQQYNALIPTISGTQTVSPQLQTQIAEQNAINLAAPDPRAAASHAEELYNRYLSQMSGGTRIAGGGGPAPYTPPALPSAAPVAPDTRGTNIGGVTYYGGQTPLTAAQNWQDWATSVSPAPLTDEEIFYDLAT